MVRRTDTGMQSLKVAFDRKLSKNSIQLVVVFSLRLVSKAVGAGPTETVGDVTIMLVFTGSPECDGFRMTEGFEVGVAVSWSGESLFCRWCWMTILLLAVSVGADRRASTLIGRSSTARPEPN